MRKRILSGMLVLSMIVSLFSIPVLASSESEYTEGCYTYRIRNGKAYITKTQGISGNVIVPSFLGGYPVYELGMSAFKDNLTITDITVPDGVVSISEHVFSGCKNLRSLYISDSVQYIGQNQFRDCISLENVKLPSNLNYINSEMFKGCINLKSISIPNAVKYIASGAFAGCSNLNEIFIPDSVEEIWTNVFSGTGIEANPLNWHNSVFYVGKYLIKANPNISGKYVVKDGTKSISWSAFENCTNLTEIVLPSSLKGIYPYSFRNCTNLRYIKYDDNIKLEHIGWQVFQNTYWMNDFLNSGKSELCIGNVLVCANKWLKGTYSIPYGITTIADEAFIECPYVETIIVGDGVKVIGYRAFSHCDNLSSITISDDVELIDYQAFRFAPNLRDIWYEGSEERWNKTSRESINAIISKGTSEERNTTIHFNFKKVKLDISPKEGVSTVNNQQGTGDTFIFTAITPPEVNEISLLADKFNGIEWHEISFDYLQRNYHLEAHINNENEKVWTCRFGINDSGYRTFKLKIDGANTDIEANVTVIENNGSFSPTPQQGNISVVVNGEYVNFDVQPQIINGRTMVPVRAIFEALGATVTWEPETQRVHAEKWYEPTQGLVFAIFEIGSNVMINSFGEMYDYIDTPAMIIDGRTLVPARAAAEAFDYKVSWDEATKTVYIYE